MLYGSNSDATDWRTRSDVRRRVRPSLEMESAWTTTFLSRISVEHEPQECACAPLHTFSPTFSFQKMRSRTRRAERQRHTVCRHETHPCRCFARLARCAHRPRHSDDGLRAICDRDRRWRYAVPAPNSIEAQFGFLAVSTSDGDAFGWFRHFGTVQGQTFDFTGESPASAPILSTTEPGSVASSPETARRIRR